MSDPIGLSVNDTNYSGPAIMTQEELSPKPVGVESPQYSGPPGAEEQTKLQYERIRAIADTMENPEQEMENILAADYIAQRFQKPTGHVYKNLDAYSQAYFQSPDIAKTPWRAVTDEFGRSYLSIQAAQKGLEMMVNPYDETLYEEYGDILSQMPAPDGSDRNIFEKTLKSTASIAPSIGYILANGLATGTAGAAIGGLAGYALAGAPGAAAGATKGYDWGTKIGTAKESFSLAAGGIFSEVMMVEVPDTGMKLYEVMMQNEGEDRNKILNIARAAAAAGGTLSAAIEYLSGTYSRVTGTAASFTDDVADRVIKQILKDGYATKAVSRALLKYGLNAGTEALQEVSQEMIEKGATEAAKYFMNEAEKLGIPYAELSEWGQEAKDVAGQTFLGMLGIGLPGAMVNTYRDSADALSDKKATVPQGYRKTSTSTAVPIEDIMDGKFTEDEYAQAQAQYEADGKSRAPLQVIQTEEGLVAAEPAAYQVALEHGESAVEVEIIEGPLTNEQNSRVKEKPDWAMNSEEFSQRQQFRQNTGKQFRDANSLEDFRYNVRQAFPDISEEESQAMVGMVEARAAVQGLSPDEYIQQTFDPQIFTQGRIPGKNYKAAAQFKEDGRAIIHLTEASDFSSFVHEYGHIIRRSLPENDLGTLLTHYQVESWDRNTEEAFVKDFENYLHEGTAPTSGLKELFRRLAAGLKAIWDRIGREGATVAEGIRPVFNRIFDGEGSVAADPVKGESVVAQPTILFQQAPPVESQAFKEWFGDSKVVNEDGSPKVMYHGTSAEFDQFIDQPAANGKMWGQGFYFTENKADAKDWGGEKAIVLEVFLSLKNPLVLTGDAVTSGNVTIELLPEEFRQWIVETHGDEVVQKSLDGEFLTAFDTADWANNNLRDYAKEYGYDGVMGEFGKKQHAVAFESSQIKATENTGTWNKNDPRILFQEAEPTESPEFKKWFDDSEVVDSKGEPLVMYHGSPVVFDSFDISKIGQHATAEGYGFYFTDNQSIAEGYKPDEGKLFKVYLSIKKSLDADAPAFSGSSLRKLIKGVVQAEIEAYPDEIEDYKDSFLSNMADTYSTTFDGAVDEACEMLVDNNTAIDQISEIANILGSKEIMFKGVQSSLGFDGVYVQDFQEGEGNVYLAWFPEQIKSLENQGTWSADDPRILFQLNPEHEQIIKTAVEEFKPVPADVLEEYSDRPWAQHELTRREVLKDYAWLEDMADTDYDEETGREGWEVFRDDVKDYATAMMMPDEVEAMESIGGAEDRFYKEIWSRANFSSREDKNKKFIETYANKEGVMQIVMDVVTDWDKWGGSGLPGPFFKLAAKQKHNGSITDDLINSAIKSVEENPIAVRKAMANFSGDQLEMMQLQYEDEIEEATPYKVKVERMSEDERMKLYAKTEDLELRKILLDGIGSDQETLEKMDKAVQAKMGTLKAQQTKAMNELEEKLDLERRRVMNLQDTIRRKQKEYEEATEEAKAGKEAEIKELKDKAKSREKKIREKRDEKIKRIKTEFAAAQKKRRELQRVKALSRRLGKNITKKPARTCHVDWKKKIMELQEQIGMDPRYRRKSTLEELSQVRTRILSGEEHGYSEEYIKEAFAKPLNEWTLPVLEQINEKINALRKEGRQAFTEEMENRRIQRDRDVNNILLEVLEHDPLGSIFAEGSKEREEEKKTGIKAALDFGWLTPARLLMDMGGENSTLTRLFDDGVNSATDEELRRTRDRHANMKEIREKLGVSETDLASEIAGPQGTYSMDQVIHMWAIRDNVDNMKALKYGNGVKTPSVYTDNLTAAQKAYGDALRQDFENHREEYAEAIGKYTHGIMGVVESGYFPMYRKGKVGETHPSEMLKDVLSAAAVSKAYPSKDRSKARIKISDEHQTPIELGASTVWAKAMAENEHFIAFADRIRHLQSIVDNAYFQKGITEKYGTKAVQWFKKYINDVENPHLYDAYDGLSKTSKMLRRNRAMAYLAGNSLTVLKQFGSFSTYFRDVPPHLMMASAAKYMANHQEIERFVKERDPQMVDRVMERELEELRLAKEHPVTKVFQKGTGAMMKAISWMDKNTVMIGWKAAYDYRIAKGDSEQDAIRYAQKATLETQPSARAKDLAQIYRSTEGFNWFLMFTNQLNKNWNILWSDIPRAVRNHQLGRAIAAFSGLLVSIYAISLVSGWQPWEEDDLEGFMKSLGRQTVKGFTGFVPFVGGAVTSAMNGWSSGGTDPFPFAAPVGHIAREAMEGDLEGVGNWLPELAEGAGTMIGFPVVLAKRAARAAGEISEDEYLAAIAEFIGYHGDD